MSDNYFEIISRDGVYPIIRNKDPKQTIEIAKALVEGGISVLEINVEAPEIYEAIKEVSKYATVCAGASGIPGEAGEIEETPEQAEGRARRA